MLEQNRRGQTNCIAMIPVERMAEKEFKDTFLM
jgi:hypothetical protein